MSALFDLSSYRFELPENLIASEPLAKRDSSRLMVIHKKSKKIIHHQIEDLPLLINRGSIMVANNTAVFRARLLGVREGTGGKVEFFMLKKVSERCWQGLMKAGARIEAGFTFQFHAYDGEVILARVLKREESPSGTLYTAEFTKDPLQHGGGEVPLPPYIVSKRQSIDKTLVNENELEMYNTVFKKEIGSVAAPTAGRHFTKELIAQLVNAGVQWRELTLHVGIGTFKPVSASDIRAHEMHEEMAKISPELCQEIIEAKGERKEVIAIGTTSVRALEGSASYGKDGELHLRSGSHGVNLFIHPGVEYQWKVVDGMLTNFHLPESTLIMMVASFIGDLEFTLHAYQTAIENQYRFYSYGDAMLILNR